MKIVLIGIDDNREQYFKPDVMKLIASSRCFSGGTRHYEIMRPYLPKEHIWLSITIPLAPVFERYKAYDDIVVFASGDPLFYGFGNTLLREFPEADFKVYPSFNSLQMLAHRCLLPYQDMHIVSLTGRPWLRFDEALIEGKALIGVLTDNKHHTPSTIAARMLEYGYDNYQMIVGELLGNTVSERVSKWSLSDVIGRVFAYPNNIILCRKYKRNRSFGISEQAFALLNGRAKMITKMPIRLLSLSMMDLRKKSVMWDVGFCTGSVSIEAKLQFPHLEIVAFEQREEGASLLSENSRRFGTPGIIGVIGDFTAVDLDPYPLPDAVFIGGHGGKMMMIVEQIAPRLKEGGCIVFNSVSHESRELFISAIEHVGLRCLDECRIQIDEHNPIEVLKAIK